jgi:hypothetical protein
MQPASGGTPASSGPGPPEIDAKKRALVRVPELLLVQKCLIIVFLIVTTEYGAASTGFPGTC